MKKVELVDQPMRLKYYNPELRSITDAGPARLETGWYDGWLDYMLGIDRRFIFFFVVETTDVFEKEWDFNEVAMPELPDGVYWKSGSDAMVAPFEPRTPCRQFETRPCVDLSEDVSMRYRVLPCKPSLCRRFPNRDSKEHQE